jgi:hypothetical protein
MRKGKEKNTENTLKNTKKKNGYKVQRKENIVKKE